MSDCLGKIKIMNPKIIPYIKIVLLGSLWSKKRQKKRKKIRKLIPNANDYST